MDVDIVKLAGEAAAALAPFLPYLLKGGKAAAQKAFEKAGEKLVEEAGAKAEALWEKLKPKVEEKPAAKDVVEEFDPADDDALPALRQQIRKILADDSNFAKEISLTIGSINVSSMRAGDDSILIGGSVGRKFCQGRSEHHRRANSNRY